MKNEPFDRTKSHVNIGKIGESPTKEDIQRTVDTIGFIVKNGEEYNQAVLAKLISVYGEEGKRIYQQMILQETIINDVIENIDDDKESSKKR